MVVAQALPLTTISRIDLTGDSLHPILQEPGGTESAGTQLPSVESFFVENRGQGGEGAGLYYAEGEPFSVALGIGWVGFDVHDADGSGGALIRMGFPYANAVPPRGQDACGSRLNFLVGDDPGMWQRDVKCYRLVIYADLWDGIDLEFRFDGGRLKYDVTVHPGADANMVRFDYRGADRLEVERGTGDLLIGASGTVLRDAAPEALQWGRDAPVRCMCGFEKLNGTSVGFRLGGYDPGRPLVIDPGLVFGTLIGGGKQDSPAMVALDEADNIYLTGWTCSPDFPTVPGSYKSSSDTVGNNNGEGFVAKLDPSGSKLVYSTFFGGRKDDGCFALFVDGKGSAYVTGWTESPDFPTTQGAYCTTLNTGHYNAYLAKLSPDGSSLMASTLLGGYWDDMGYSVSADAQGDPVVCGLTKSGDFPVTAGAFDGSLSNAPGEKDDVFVARLSANMTALLYSTYIGGDGFDSPLRCHLDADGSLYIGGKTSSTDFPTTPGAYDRAAPGSDSEAKGFVLRFDITTGILVFSTFVGGDILISQLAMCVDDDGCAYVATSADGASGSPGTSNSTRGMDVYVAKLDADASELLATRTFGGSAWEMPSDIEVDPFGNMYVVGETLSDDLPTTSGCFCSTRTGEEDGFLAVLSPDASLLLHCTYFGGKGSDSVRDMALDSTYRAVAAGDTMIGSDRPVANPNAVFPATNPPLTGYMVNWVTGFVLKLDPEVAGFAALSFKEGPILYSDLQAYDFVVDANPMRAKQPPTSVRLVLDAGGAEVVLGCDHRTAGWDLLPIDDPRGLVSLESGPADIVPDPRNTSTSIHFRVRFGWNWPHEDLCDVALNLSGAPGRAVRPVYERLFRVENDLAFHGDLIVVGEWQGRLAKGSWVRAGEPMNISGTRVVYEGTTDVFPPAGVCDVLALDDDGGANSVRLGEDGAFEIGILADDATDLDETLRLSLDRLPPGATLVSDVPFPLRVDGDAPEFGVAIPEPDSWHSSSDVLISITVHDNATSGVDSSSLEYAYVVKGEGGFSPWGQGGLNATPDGGAVDGMVILRLPDGDDNFIRWRATDLVGNLASSPPLQLKVDTLNVSFRDPVPDSESWHKAEVDCGVTVEDPGGSGIDVSTIQYRFSGHNLSGYGRWQALDMPGLSDSVSVSTLVGLTLAETRYNYVQWRAKDLVGHGYTSSPHYRVQVDTTPIIFRAFSPPEDVVQNRTDVTCWATIEDPGEGSGVNLSSVEYRVALSDLPGRPPSITWSPWRSVGMQGVSRSNTFSVAMVLAYGSENLVQLRGTDAAGNDPSVSPDHRIVVDDRPPEFSDPLPLPSAKQPGPLVEVSVTIEDGLIGVDAGAIWCRHSDRTTGTPGAWTPVTATASNGAFRVKVALDVHPGHDNRLQVRARDLAGNEATSSMIEVWVNSPPESIIGKEVDEANPDLMTLSASASSDPDGDALNYTWHLDGSGEALAYGERVPIGPLHLALGNHTFTLVVTDDMGAADSAETTITIAPPPSLKTRDSGDPTWMILLLVIIIALSGTGYLYFRHRALERA